MAGRARGDSLNDDYDHKCRFLKKRWMWWKKRDKDVKKGDERGIKMRGKKEENKLSARWSRNLALLSITIFKLLSHKMGSFITQVQSFFVCESKKRLSSEVLLVSLVRWMFWIFIYHQFVCFRLLSCFELGFFYFFPLSFFVDGLIVNSFDFGLVSIALLSVR